jgi:hypothetical protein
LNTLPATLPKVCHGPPLRDVSLRRDEIAEEEYDSESNAGDCKEVLDGVQARDGREVLVQQTRGHEDDGRGKDDARTREDGDAAK